MRCPDCNKFVSYDADVEPEINAEVDEEGVIGGDVRIVNTCQDCGTELKEATFTIDADVSAEVTAHRDSFPKEEQKDHDELSLDDDGGSRFEDVVNKDRHGKPIKSARYMKHLYGAEVEFTVTCKCGETFTTSWRDSVQASSMDELT